MDEQLDLRSDAEAQPDGEAWGGPATRGAWLRTLSHDLRSPVGALALEVYLLKALAAELVSADNPAARARVAARLAASAENIDRAQLRLSELASTVDRLRARLAGDAG